MKRKFSVVPALAVLIGCAIAVPALAHEKAAKPQDPNMSPKPMKKKTRAAAPSNMQGSMSPDAGMMSRPMMDDTPFTNFYANLQKTNDTLDKLTQLLVQIDAHGGQHQQPAAAPPAGNGQ